LEQKISDAGPTNQRVEPHILTEALRELQTTREIVTTTIGRTPWYNLSSAAASEIESRLGLLVPIYEATQTGEMRTRLGQTLEMATYKSLVRYETRQQFLGHFSDLETHGDEEPYTKVDPPQVVGRRTLKKGRLDFVVFGDGGPAGIEVKNYRQWLYPERLEVRELLRKCCEIDTVPVLIARRFPYLTFQLLHYAGALVHQTYNQLYFEADRPVGELAQDKDLLGYHDIRFGTEPDARLLRFIGHNVSKTLPEARERFDALKHVHVKPARERKPLFKFTQTY